MQHLTEVPEDAPSSAPMRWANYGDEYLAQGAGRRWLIVQHAAPPGEQGLRYTLSSRPLEGGTYKEIALGCLSLQAAKDAAAGGGGVQ